MIAQEGLGEDSNLPHPHPSSLARRCNAVTKTENKSLNQAHSISTRRGYTRQACPVVTQHRTKPNSIRLLQQLSIPNSIHLQQQRRTPQAQNQTQSACCNNTVPDRTQSVCYNNSLSQTQFICNNNAVPNRTQSVSVHLASLLIVLLKLVYELACANIEIIAAYWTATILTC
jgi:hypothetical protein